MKHPLHGVDAKQGPTSSPISISPTGKTQIFGLDTFKGGMTDLLREIEIKRKLSKPHLVVTANIDHLINLADSDEFMAVYSRASIRLLDGMPLVRLARRLGARGTERLTGADLLNECARESVVRSWTIALVGGSASTKLAADRLVAANPTSRIHSVALPMISSVSDASSLITIDALHALEPDVVFVCIGSPKQEYWFDEWSSRLPPAVYIGAGAAVEFAAGDRQRAPKWAQDLGLEWVWRVAQEPKRLLRRYLFKGPRFFRLRTQSIRAAANS